MFHETILLSHKDIDMRFFSSDIVVINTHTCPLFSLADVTQGAGCICPEPPYFNRMTTDFFLSVGVIVIFRLWKNKRVMFYVQNYGKDSFKLACVIWSMCEYLTNFYLCFRVLYTECIKMIGAVSICHYGFQNARRSKFPTWNETAVVQVLCACAIPLPSSLSVCDVTKR